MTRFFQRVFNLLPTDLRPGFLLFSYLFLVMTSYQLGKIIRAALFLDQYRASKIPYAEVVIAVSVGFVVAGYVWIGRKTNLRNLLIGSVAVYSAIFGLCWYMAHFHPDSQAWLYPVFYVWVGIFGVLSTAQVWTLANYVLTTRQAKRVFTLLASGAIVGATFGGLLANALAVRAGAETLVLVMCAAMALCGILIHLIWKVRPASVEAGDAPAEGAKNGGETERDFNATIKVVLASKYLIVIALVIFISSLVTKSVEWQFTALTKQFVPDTNALAAFLGRFYMVTGSLCLVTQLLLTSRILRYFGIGPALFVLPIILLSGELGVLAMGTLLSVLALRGGDQVARYSIDKSSTELLYLPVSGDVKLQAKSFIDTFIWRSGDGVAGAMLALFADRLGWSPVRIGWLVVAYLTGWICVAVIARKEYVTTLRESILQHRLDAERASAPVLDRSTTEILAANLRATDPQEILYALDLFTMGQQRATHPAVRDLLKHPAPEVRQRALKILGEANDKTVRGQVEKMLSDPELDVRTEALLYLTHHAHIDPLSRIQELGDFADFSIRSAMVSFLAHPGATQNLEAARVLLDTMVREPGAEGQRTRLEAARLLSALPDKFDNELRHLLMDEDAEVARAAIRAVGKLNKRIFVIRALDRLGEPALAPDIIEAIGAMGDRVVGALRDHLGDSAVPMDVRRELPGILVRVGTSAAARALEEHLLQADTILRFRVISALNKLRHSNPEVQIDEQMIETVLAAEMMGHYRSYQILGTLGGNLEADDPVVRALKETLEQEVERIFRLLGLLFPRHDLYSAYFGLQSTDSVVHANALEFLDNILKPQLRNVLVPLLDSDVSVEARVRKANQIVGTGVQSQEEAVLALILSEDPWLKSCGAYAIGSLGLQELAHQLESCLHHSDPLLRETARQAKLRLGLTTA